MHEQDKIVYSMSCDGYGDGKSICLWRTDKSIMRKIARFQSDYDAALFADEMEFPLSDNVRKRTEIAKTQYKNDK